MPADTLPTPPRTIRRRWKSALATWFIVVMGLIGPQVIVGIGYWLQRSHTELRTEGVEAVGMIAQMRRAAKSGDSPRVDVRYKVEGKTYDVWEGVAQSYFDTLQVGQEVAVLHLPDDPSQGGLARNIIGVETSSGAMAMWMMAGIFSLIGVPLLFYLQRLVRPLRFLARHGLPAEATIESAACTMRFRGNETWRVEYAFEVQGQSYRRVTKLVPAAAANALTIGGPATVLYNPADPKISELLAAVDPYFEMTPGEQPAPFAPDESKPAGEKLATLGVVVSAVGIPFCGLASPGGLAVSFLAFLQQSSPKAWLGIIMGLIGLGAWLSVGTDAIVHPTGTRPEVQLQADRQFGYWFPGPDGQIGTDDDLRRTTANPHALANQFIDQSAAASHEGDKLFTDADATRKQFFAPANLAAFPAERAALSAEAKAIIEQFRQAAAKYREAAKDLSQAAAEAVDPVLTECYNLLAQNGEKRAEVADAVGAALRLIDDPAIADLAALQAEIDKAIVAAAKRNQEARELADRYQALHDAHPEKFKPLGAP